MTLSVAGAGTLFRPRSQCDAACLSPAAPHAHQMRQLVRATNALAVVAATFLAGVLISVMPEALRARWARSLLTRSSRALLRALDITMTQSGVALPQRRALLVANHISWLDIIAMLAVGRVRIVAKKDVASWPVIGRLARLSGAVFIDRERPLTLPATVSEIRAALDQGDLVVAFAEGTTSCGRHAIPYRPAVFQAAIDASACVVPVALRYRSGDGLPTPEPAFIGDQNLMTSLKRVLSMPSARLDLRVYAGLHPQQGTTRAALVRVVGRAFGGAA